MTEEDWGTLAAWGILVSSGPKKLGVDSFVTTAVNGELLVYDPEQKHLHHLNHISAMVWQLCDGQRSVSSIAGFATAELGEPVDEEEVRMALALLEKASLIDAGESGRTRGSRRSFLRKAAIGGVVLPTVASMTMPSSAAASSPTCDNSQGQVPMGQCGSTNSERCCIDDNGCAFGTCDVTGICNPWIVCL